MTRAGAAIVIVTVLTAVIGPAFIGVDPAFQDLPLRLEGPSPAHWFGLDELGRDIFARLLVGARISLLVGAVVVGISASVGTLLGSIAGYYGGIVDDVVSRVSDILMAFPGLLLAIAVVAVLGPSLTNVVLALTLIGWVSYARVIRGQVLRVRELEYVQAARARRRDAAHSGETYRAGGGASAHCAGDARYGRCDSRRGVTEFSGTRRAAADAELGNHAQLRSVALARRPTPHDLSGPRHRGPRARIQFPGRRVARYARSDDVRGQTRLAARTSRRHLSRLSRD
jgi:hypothetical protein